MTMTRKDTEIVKILLDYSRNINIATHLKEGTLLVGLRRITILRGVSGVIVDVSFDSR